MRGKATDTQMQGVGETLRTDPTVTRYRFDGGIVYREHLRLFTGTTSSERPLLARATRTGPAEFRVTLSKSLDWSTVKRRYGTMPGVERITISN
jgi:hypothetical protein